MSREISTSFICPACETGNPTRIAKPNFHEPTIARRECETCESIFLIRFGKVKNEHKVSYMFIKMEWSEMANKNYLKKIKNPQLSGVATEE